MSCKAGDEMKSGTFEVNFNATIEGLRALTLHGTALPERLRVQDKVRIKMILGVVNEIERQSEPGARNI
jgi:hypothetical protein